MEKDREKGPLQKLLLLEEYSDLEDLVVVEGPFVELDKCGDAVQQVIIGLSPDHLFMSRRQVLNWKEDPMIIDNVDADLATYCLELKWITPLRIVDISTVEGEFVLKISSRHARCRYFELCTFPKRESTWTKWLERIQYLRDDPYKYISKLPLHRDSSGSLTSSHDVSSASSSQSMISSGGSDGDLESLSGGEDDRPHGDVREINQVTMTESPSPASGDNVVLNKSKSPKKKGVFSRIFKRKAKRIKPSSDR